MFSEPRALRALPQYNLIAHQLKYPPYAPAAGSV